MGKFEEKIDQLYHKLNILLQKQDQFTKEIKSLREEIDYLKNLDNLGILQGKEPADPTEYKSTVSAEENIKTQTKPVYEPAFIKQKPERQKGQPSNLEKFIGENLINKIGIVITIIGVAIGAKYAIDHQLISPLTRIILGYLFGAGLLSVAIKLKKNYENYSAVLLSGSMAILYFITYAAYSFYNLMPNLMAFILMVCFTAFTVLSALKYNKQVIAHIGLAGAYAVPFLLSEGSGRVGILFSYMAIINAGILFIAFKKNWKPLYYVSFGLSWLIYASWFIMSFQYDIHFTLAFIFLTIFFVTFYLMFLVYKLINKENFRIDDIILLLINSFIFYGFGYSLLDMHPAGSQLLGLFTLLNAAVHFIVCYLIYKQKLADRNLFYFVAGLVLVFITIAIPVQLDGNWVTLLWTGEAVLLFYIGRTRNVPVYENLSYILMVIAFFSIIQDWSLSYDNYNYRTQSEITPIINIHFLTSVLFAVAFGFISILSRNKKYTPQDTGNNGLRIIAQYLIPSIFFIVLYYSFRLEIENYFTQVFNKSSVLVNTADGYNSSYYNYDILNFKNVWIINYSIVFLAVISFINITKWKDKQLGIVNLLLNILITLVFLTYGLFILSELRDSYISKPLTEYYYYSFFNIAIRYISFMLLTGLLFLTYKYIERDIIGIKLKKGFEIFLHITILWILSSELITWMNYTGSTEAYKLGLSILWGVYSLLLIILGIWKNRQFLRIGAMILFAVILTKLFFYDIAHLGTISKTIVFVSLGILLLIISFLYNKYKNLISVEIEK